MSPMKIDELPPVDGDTKNLDELPHFIPCDGYTVSEYHAERDGKGQAVAIVLRLPVKLEGLPTFELHLRIKSARAADELVAVLKRHRRSVWGDEGSS